MNVNLRNITNSFLDVRLVSLKSWRQASEIVPRDNGGPYVVMQEGYDPDDMTVTPDEFVLGRSGRWLPLGYFFKMPVTERRKEFVFGTAAEVMQTLSDLPPKVEVLSRTANEADATVPRANDDMAAAFQAAKNKDSGKT